MIIGDPEDPPAGGSYADPRERPTMDPPGFATEEEETKVATPAPQARKETRQITLADIFDAIGKLTERVASIDAGLTTAWDEIQALRGDMGTGFDGVIAKQIAHGTVLAQVANDVGLLRQQADSALGAVSKIPPRLERIEQGQAQALRLSCASYDVALRGPEGIPDDERKECDAIRDAVRSAR